MIERYYPPYEQLLGLHKLLAILSSGKIYWHDIEMRGETILIRTDPLKGEFDLRIFYIFKDGEVDNDDFRELWN